MRCKNSICNKLKRIVFGVFPHLSARLANKQVRKTNVNNQQDKKSYLIEKAPPKDLAELTKEQFEQTIYQKDKLEDKAKTNVIGITIAITLIIGSASILGTIEKKYSFPIVQIISSVLIVVAIIYLIVAGLSVIKVLCDENIISFPDPNKISNQPASMIQEYEKCIEENKKYNLIRNNYIYASYKGIRNALISLFLVVMIAVFPIGIMIDKENGSKDFIDNHLTSISYSQKVVDMIKDTHVQQTVQKSIIKYYNQITSTEKPYVSFIDDSKQYFIKCSVKNDVILVEELEAITSLNE